MPHLHNFERDLNFLVESFKLALFEKTSISESNRICLKSDVPEVILLSEKFRADVQILRTKYLELSPTLADSLNLARSVKRVSNEIDLYVDFRQILS